MTDKAIEQDIPIEVWFYMQRYHDKVARSKKSNDIEKETGFNFDDLKFEED